MWIITPASAAGWFVLRWRRRELVACLPTAHQLGARVQMSRLSIKAGFLIRAALSPGYSSGVTSDKSALTDHCNFPSQRRAYTNTHLVCLFFVLFSLFCLSYPTFPLYSFISTQHQATGPLSCCWFSVNALSVLINRRAFSSPLVPCQTRQVD